MRYFKMEQLGFTCIFKINIALDGCNWDFKKMLLKRSIMYIIRKMMSFAYILVLLKDRKKKNPTNSQYLQHFHYFPVFSFHN